MDVAVLANDTDPNGDALTVTAIAMAPAHGTATINAGGQTVRYTPTAGYSGSDSFQYTVSDGRGGTATGTVNLTVGSQATVGGQVTFIVNMNREIRLGNLRSGRIVALMGSHAPLSWDVTTLMSDGNLDGIYEVTIPFNLALGTTLQYKFVFGPAMSYAWEGTVGPGEFGNRVLNYAGTAIVAVVAWNNVTGVEAEIGGELPTAFALSSVYPNPFNPTARVAFLMAADAPVRIDVTDSQGRVVRTLVDAVRTAGRHEVELDAAELPSGIYLVTMRAGSVRTTRTVALVK